MMKFTELGKTGTEKSTRINIKNSHVVVKNMLSGVHLCGLEFWSHQL